MSRINKNFIVKSGNEGHRNKWFNESVKNSEAFGDQKRSEPYFYTILYYKQSSSKADDM